MKGRRKEVVATNVVHGGLYETVIVLIILIIIIIIIIIINITPLI